MPRAFEQLSSRELDALHSELHQQALDHFDLGVLKAASGKLSSDAAMAQAQALADPLLVQAAAIDAERLRRLHRVARRSRIVALAIAVAGVLLLGWLIVSR